jgi:branched-chain amino acid transport system substrate-binding protein
VIEDDKGSPEEAARLTTKLIDHDKVVAIIAGGTSGNSRAAAPKAQSSHIAFISPSATDPPSRKPAITSFAPALSIRFRAK